MSSMGTEKGRKWRIFTDPLPHLDAQKFLLVAKVLSRTGEARVRRVNEQVSVIVVPEIEKQRVS